MNREVHLPQVELTMESAVVARWLVQVGDRVHAEQPLLEVETQKAVSEVPSPVAGFVRKLCVQQGQMINEKALLCILTDTADELLESAASNNRQTDATHLSSNQQRTRISDGVVKASPVARRVAKELGVDLSTITGTGPSGRISEDDVRNAASRTTSALAPSTEEWKPLAATRIALNELMTRSLAEIPQIHLQRQLDVTALAKKTEGITFTHRLIVAAAAALQKHPVLRTQIRGTQIKVEPVSIAIAMDTPYGLLAPAIRDADRLSLEQIVAAVQSLRAKGDANLLTRAELTNATFAITNLGMFDIDQFDAFVFHGQTAVLSVGRSIDAADGKKLAWLGLAVDHRVVDGAEAARFLQTLQAEIQRRSLPARIDPD